MPHIPNFSSPTLFPPFTSCPLSTSTTPHEPTIYYLVGSILENMTLTPRTPTYICRDRDGNSYAVTVKLKEGEEFDGRGWRKGCVVVVPKARRSGYREENKEEGQKEKQGFVEVAKGDVGLIPTTVEMLLEMGERYNGDDEEKKVCQGCGTGEGKMNRCKGCEGVWYCGKECQVKGWSDGGHKTECKVLKAVGDIFGKEL